MKKKKGFTLVELLAVIVILAVILVISVPKILTVIETSKKGSLEDATKLIAKTAEKEYVERTVLGTLDQVNDPILCNDVAKMDSDNYSNCKLSFDSNGVAYVSIEGSEKFDSYVCLNGTKSNANCGKTLNVYEETLLNGAYPRVTTGMIPVIISNSGVASTIDPTSSNWYSYTDKKWANVVLVKENGAHTREYYESNYGVSITESDILAYLVWIPRYRYTLWNVAGNAATYSGSTCTANCPQTISITFEDADTTKSTGSTNGTQLTHPAFTYNGTELNGIWVGKFETTPLTGTTCSTTQNLTNCVNASPSIKPNTKSLVYQNVSSEFNTSLKFASDTTYGLIGESRVSKNSEWGAILYLAYSQYGINQKIRINNYEDWDNDYAPKTGCGALTDDKDPINVCENAYGSVTSYPQSTTGNIYGIFDIAGGANEYQMSIYTNASNEIYSGTCNNKNSGFNGKYSNPSYYGCTSSILSKTDGIEFPNNKYYKLYTSTNWYSNVNNLGEALGETRKWYAGTYTAPFVDASYPWMLRGGYYLYSPGGFDFGGMTGLNDSYNNSMSFRTVIITI